MFGSSSSFFDPSLDELFGSEFPDSGLGLDYDSGFTLNGVCDSFCQEARSQASDFEKSVREFEAKFDGRGGAGSFPSFDSGFPGTQGAGPTARPRVQVTPFTDFPRCRALGALHPPGQGDGEDPGGGDQAPRHPQGRHPAHQHQVGC